MHRTLSNQLTRILAIPALLFILASGGVGCANQREIDHNEPMMILWFLILADPLAPLTDYDFSILPNEQKYRVANRMLGSMYSGISLDKLFNVENGLDNRVIKKKYAAFMSQANLRMHRSLRPDERVRFDGEVAANSFREAAQGRPLAQFHHFPVTKDRFDIWMTYVLLNSVQYSPGRELDSVEDEDMERVFQRLLRGVSEDRPMRAILYEHMTSQENWRRFRSPEDNTREMMEIYNGHFQDDDVPMASKACQNWSLNPRNELVIGGDVNTEPQFLALTPGRSITTCEQFYAAVANHDLVPGVIGFILIQRFFPQLSEAEQRNMALWILLRKPQTYRDVFLTILNSRAYLLTAQRGRYFEESFYNFRAKTGWSAPGNFFRDLPNRMTEMRQEVFELKLGRERPAPVDSLSLAHHHTRLRESGALDQKRDPNNPNDGGWSSELMNAPVPDGEYLRFLFLSIVEREPVPEELDTLQEIIADQGYTMSRNKDRITSIALDYFSRLPELYTYPPVF
ncbi:MAG: hypothetical protein RIF32_10075 [Leptospirales bacterium]|jgi:hypothetical protein